MFLGGAPPQRLRIRPGPQGVRLPEGFRRSGALAPLGCRVSGLVNASGDEFDRKDRSSAEPKHALTGHHIESHMRVYPCETNFLASVSITASLGLNRPEPSTTPSGSVLSVLCWSRAAETASAPFLWMRRSTVSEFAQVSPEHVPPMLAVLPEGDCLQVERLLPTPGTETTPAKPMTTPEPKPPELQARRSVRPVP